MVILIGFVGSNHEKQSMSTSRRKLTSTMVVMSNQKATPDRIP